MTAKRKIDLVLNVLNHLDVRTCCNTNRGGCGSDTFPTISTRS